MSTQLFRATALGGLVGAALLLTGAGTVHAQGRIANDRPTGFLVFPKVISDPVDAFNRGQTIDTVIQLTNTDDSGNPRAVHCFYVNATGVCLGGTNPSGGLHCRTNDDCSSNQCDTSTWSETDFFLQLTRDQPTGWVASEARNLDIVTMGVGSGTAFAVPTEDFFQGELKCVEVADVTSALPINRNDLKGEATIYTLSRDPNDPNDITNVDVRRYNAIGFPALGTPDAVQNDHTLCLGGNGIGGNVCAVAEYPACPEKLIVNHLFAGASPEDIDADPSVTLVPCTELLGTDDPTSVTVQMLVFNEFEQRFSLSTRVDCYRDIRLRDLSILYDVGTQGTVAGQTVLRGVPSGDIAQKGFGLLAVAEQGTSAGSTAYNVVYSASLENMADFVTTFGDSGPD